MRGLRHAAVNIALGHHNLSLKFEQSPRRCSAAGQAEVDSAGPAALPVHESRNRPAVIDVSVRGVLVTRIAISADHESIGQPNRASPDLFRRCSLVCKTNGNPGLNVDIIKNYESPSQ
jgi:hypothetical protein